jgi:uncharacterized protein (TIGR02996 family)
MTTEDDFQAALDANPDDHNTRLVFADWLQDRDDPRAEAYRALGLLQRRPGCWRAYDSRTYALWCWRAGSGTTSEAEELLPDDWYALLARHEHQPACAAEWRTRREAEEDAITAFAKLPAARRAELLAKAPLTGGTSPAANSRPSN